MQHQESQADNLLVARLDNSKNLSNLLKAIHFKDVCTWFYFCLSYILARKTHECTITITFLFFIYLFIYF